jgi:hypothetical protein
MIQNVSVQAGQKLDIYQIKSANYSGYISVWMEGLNLNSTRLTVAWGTNIFPHVEYNETRDFQGTPFAPHSNYVNEEYFPILQGGYSNITLENNGNQTITELVRIAYYY